MKTITVIAYNRPEYLRRTLTALKECRGIKDYLVLVSIDGPANVSYKCCDVALELDCLYRMMPCNRGINEHPWQAYEHIFGQWKSEFNVVFEDDCVPAPDALELCNWFYGISDLDQYACLCLHGHSRNQSCPLYVYEEMSFAPWGWAVTKRKWETVFNPYWNAHRNGWDWSCSYTIKRLGLKVLRPELSRTLNIGRESGVHMSEQHWDQNFDGLVCSDGTHGNNYQVAARLPEGYEKRVDDWVKEYKREG